MSGHRSGIAATALIGLLLMTLSACQRGAMTASEMVCCAEHHRDCEMDSVAESCCQPDHRVDGGMIKPDRPDDTTVTSRSVLSASTWVTPDAGVARVGAVAAPTVSPPGPRPHLLSPVLLI